MTTTASARGRSNRRRGLDAERDLAAYLRFWWPNARRAVATASSVAPDPGDIAGVPFIVSVKNAARHDIPGWYMDLLGMGRDDPVALRLLVVKRRGHGDPREWWCWLTINALADLCDGRGIDGEYGMALVCCDLGTVVGLLRERGYAS